MPDQIDLSKMQSVVELGPYGYKRLNRYWCHPDGNMWDHIWSATAFRDYWDSALKSSKKYEFEKFLSPCSRLLEAGCGVGHVVLSLRSKGFDCHGIDFANNTIKMLNHEFPNVPFVSGDIRSVPYPNDYFDGYISLGVIEHFPTGQLEILQEASRVVKKGGTIVVSVPALNGYRRLRCRLKLYDKSYNLPYFESCLSEKELCDLINKVGFTVSSVIYGNPVMTFMQETPLRPIYKLIEDTRYVRGAVDKIFKHILSKSFFGHMIMVIGKKS